MVIEALSYAGVNSRDLARLDVLLNAIADLDRPPAPAVYRSLQVARSSINRRPIWQEQARGYAAAAMAALLEIGMGTTEAAKKVSDTVKSASLIAPTGAAKPWEKIEKAYEQVTDARFAAGIAPHDSSDLAVIILDEELHRLSQVRTLVETERREMALRVLASENLSRLRFILDFEEQRAKSHRSTTSQLPP